MLPFLDIHNFDKKSDFGQIGSDNVDYRFFAETCKNPHFANKAVKAKNDEIRDFKSELRDIPVPDKYSDEDDIADYNDIKSLISDIEKEISKSLKYIFWLKLFIQEREIDYGNFKKRIRR